MNREEFVSKSTIAMGKGIEFGKAYVEMMSRFGFASQPQLWVIRMRNDGKTMMEALGCCHPMLPVPTSDKLAELLIDMHQTASIPVALTGASWGVAKESAHHNYDPCAMVFGCCGLDGEITGYWTRQWAPDGPVGPWTRDVERNPLLEVMKSVLRLCSAEVTMRAMFSLGMKYMDTKFGAADEAA